MHVVGLVSGGKDSIMALALAVRDGHTPVVIANLFPCSTGGETKKSGTEDNGEHAEDGKNGDLDSYCFQTVGHSIIPQLAECLELPLRRHPIAMGSSLVTSLDYSETPDTADEVEALYQLLRDIKSEFPHVQGVVSGAICSHYQRLRVEAVCHRLGLISIAPLWQFSAESVLEMLSKTGTDARMIKVASEALVPSSAFLGKPIDIALASRLLNIQNTMQIHAAGEGGEYETLVLNCAILCKTKKLELLGPIGICEDSNGVSGVAWAAELVVKVVDKSEEERLTDADIRKVFLTAPPFPCQRMKFLPPPITVEGDDDDGRSVSSLVNRWDALVSKYHDAPAVCVDRCASAKYFYGPSSSMVRQFRLPPESEGESVVDHAARLFATIRAFLDGGGGTKREAFFLLLYSPSMALFAPINKIYEQYFSIIRPPGRAFVEVNHEPYLTVDLISIPRGQSQTSLLDHDDKGVDDVRQVQPERKCLHVQSHSSWASASIGPYAQANRIRYLVVSAPRHVKNEEEKNNQEKSLRSSRAIVDHVLVSGRIGMVPKTLQLATFTDLLLSSSSAAALPPSLLVPCWGSFVAEFFFSMANSVVGLDHFGLKPNQVTHVTFFLKDVEAYRHWIVPCWTLYYETCMDANKFDGAVPVLRFVSSEEASGVAASSSLSSGGGSAGGSGLFVAARLLEVSKMPKDAMVEVILENRSVAHMDDDDDDDDVYFVV